MDFWRLSIDLLQSSHYGTEEPMQKGQKPHQKRALLMVKLGRREVLRMFKQYNGDARDY